jgi:hypothetical protein
MTIEQMESQLEKWQRFMWFSLGASAAILLSAAADAWMIPYRPGLDQYMLRLAIWILIQCAAIIPAALLILGRKWRKTPVFLRFNTIFGFFSASWIAMMSLGFNLQLFTDIPGDIPLLLLIVGLVLAGMYFSLRKKLVTAPEAMFP